MDTEETLRWLYGFNQNRWKFGLERITHLLDRLGNPQKELHCIHVAGTNGKGSVCHYISSVLQQAGYQVGLYLSPHLERFSERISINTKEIIQEDLARLAGQVKSVVDDIHDERKKPTFFELVTAIAFLYFREQKVDYAVIEVGLGGRFDATNVIIPLVSAITNISLEHTDILGKDIASIASEKAGIIKENVPVVTAADATTFTVIQKIASEKNAPIIQILKNSWKRLSHSLQRQEFSIHGTLNDYTITTSLLGMHQGENIALALAVLEHLQINGVYISENDIIEGMKSAHNPGRMEVIAEEPIILLDGAHNPGGMQMLAVTLQKDFTYEHLILVLGILKDKDIATMLPFIVPLADTVIVTRSANSRACDPTTLQQMIEQNGQCKKIVVEEILSHAVDKAKAIARTKDLICICGSLFTVGEARTYLLIKQSQR